MIGSDYQARRYGIGHGRALLTTAVAKSQPAVAIAPGLSMAAIIALVVLVAVMVAVWALYAMTQQSLPSRSTPVNRRGRSCAHRRCPSG